MEMPAHASRPSAVEYRPADVVSQALIVQDQNANRIRQLVALPAALEPAGMLALALRRSRARGLDRVCRGAELVRGDVRDRRRLTGGKCGVAGCSSQVPGGCHRVTGGSAGLGHGDLAANPCPNLLNRVSRPQVRGLHSLKEVQDVLCTRGCPPGEQVMVRIREGPPATEGDEARVALFGEDHGSPVMNTDFTYLISIEIVAH